MEVAKSMSLGGREIRAGNPKLRSHSYLELMLRCTYCGEPVYYRSGGINKPHFAHFPSIDPRKYEECLLRQKNKGCTISPDQPWWHEKEKSQRFQLFQKHFVCILKSTIPTLNTSSLRVEPQEIELGELQDRALNYAQENKNRILRYVRAFSRKTTSLEREIVSESFEYLTVASSKNIFKIVSDYVLSQTIKNEPESQSILIEQRICYSILEILESVPWLTAFSKITFSENLDFLRSLHRHSNFAQEVNALKNRCIYLDKNKLWLGSRSFYEIKNDQPLGRIDFAKLLNARWLVSTTTKSIANVQDNDFLKIFGTSSLYGEHKKFLQNKFISEFHRSIKHCVEEDFDERFKIAISNKYVFTLDRKNSAFLEDKEGNISLIEVGGKRHPSIASVKINEAAFKERKLYRFNDFLALSEEYERVIKQNPFVASALSTVVKRIYDSAMRERSRNRSRN